LIFVQLAVRFFCVQLRSRTKQLPKDPTGIGQREAPTKCRIRAAGMAVCSHQGAVDRLVDYNSGP
jgi:hypothetical protein